MTLPAPEQVQSFSQAPPPGSFTAAPPDLSAYSQQAASATQETGRLSAALDGLSQRFDGVNRRAGKKLVSFAAKDFAALSGAAADSATFEKQLGTLNATAQVTPLSMRQVKKSIEDTFTSMPVARGDVVALATSLTNLGVTGAKDVGQLIKTFEKLGAATGEGPQQLATGLVQLSRLFGNTDANKINGYANSLLTVSKNAGVSASGVLSFSQAIAPLARQAGISQASVLGISTAFSKAGADGFLAANTFNSIVSDITGLIQSGSPQLAKYANLIGVTTGEFKKMDKTTALEKIFTTISDQGPKAINTLNRLGIDGVRAQSAIAAVVQSGDLEKNIRLAQGSAGDSKNLDKASGAAKGGLVNQLTLLRNQFTDIGDTIGSGLVGPMTLATKTFTAMASAVGTLLKPFAPLIDALGVVVGLFASLGGGALIASGLLAKVALGGFVGRSSPIQALRAGRQNALGTPARTAAGRRSAEAYGTRAAVPAGQAGGLRWYQRPFYNAGQRAGNSAREVREQRERVNEARARQGLGPAPVPATRLQRIATAPIRLGTTLIGGNTQYLRDAGRPGYARSGGVLGGVGNLATRMRQRFGSDEPRRPMPGNRVYPATMSRPMPGPGGMAAATAAAERYAVAQGTATKATINSSERQVAAQRSVVAASREFVIALGKMNAATLAAGTRTAAAATGSVIARGAGAVTGALGGPIGLGLMAAVFAPSIINSISKKGETANYSTTAGLNPLQKMNDQLGVATTNLASFSRQVETAGKSVGDKIPQNVSLQQASSVSQQDVSDFKGGKNTDAALHSVAQAAGKGDVRAAAAYGRSLNMTDNRSVAGFKANLLAEGYKPEDINKILSQVTASGTAIQGGRQSDLNYLTSKSVNLEGNGLFASNASGSGRNLTGAIFSSIGQQFNNDSKNKTPGYAQTRQYQSALKVIAGLGKKVAEDPENGSLQRAMANAIQTLTGGSKRDADTYYGQLGNDSIGKGAKQLGTAEGVAKFIEKFRGSKDGGDTSKYLGQIEGAGGVTDYAKIAPYLATEINKKPKAGAYEANVRSAGQLGNFTQDNFLVKGAVANPQDPGAQYKATVGLYQQADAGSRSLAGLITGFDKLEGAIKDTSDPLYQLSRSARAYAQREQAIAAQDMSRNQQLGLASRDYRRAQIAQRDNPTADTPADLQAAKDGFIQQRQAMTQYYNSVYQQTLAFNVQMERAEEDRQTQLSRMRRDFNIAEEQGEEDFNRQRERQLRDRKIQYKQQAQTQAQSIYDPYKRVQSQYTASGGTLEQNLGDENQRLRRQKRNLDALKAMGLSVEAIQTLNLASPDQAQQLDRLVMDAKADPGLIGRLNAQTAKRVKLTKSLTQNDYNLTFAQSNEDFTKGLKDAQKDYDIARDRAVSAQKRSLDDMAKDYNKMVRRSGEDLTTSMTELYGGFASAYTRALGQMNGRINKIVPGLAKNLRSQLDSAANLINGTVQITIAPTTATGQAHENGPGYGPAPAGTKPGKTPTPTRGGMPVVVVTGGHAEGGVSTKHHVAQFSEHNKAEMIVPLEQAGGVNAMASFVQQVSMATLRTLSTRGNGLPMHGGGSGAGSGTHTEIDHSTNFNGEITVQAQDPNEMGRKLEEKKRIARLTAPTRSYGAG